MVKRILPNERYAKIYSYKGYGIYTLKTACPTRGDDMGFITDYPGLENEHFSSPEDVITLIHSKQKT